MSKMELRDLTNIQMEDFTCVLNQSFKCDMPFEGEFQLMEVVALNKQEDSRVKKHPFILVFHTSKKYPTKQGVYHLTHHEVGTLAIFLVPVGESEEHVIFEATFT